MKVSKELLERMAEQRVLRLAKILATEFKECYPSRVRMMGEKHLQEFTERCAKDAYTFGCENYGLLKNYAFIAWLLGIEYGSDPLYPWAQKIFASDEPFAVKIENVTEAYVTQYHPSTRQELIEYKEALEKLLHIDFVKVKEFTSYTEILEVLSLIYPQRVEMLGGTKQLKEALKYACYEKTIRYNIHHPIGMFVYASLVFFLGYGVHRDPLYAWVSRCLNDKEPRMAHKLDTLVKVSTKVIKETVIQIDESLKESSNEL